MASRFLSKSKLVSKFSKESRVVSVLKKQHNKNDNKLKLVVSRQHRGSNLISLLSIGDNDNITNFSRLPPHEYLYPSASCNNKLLLRSACMNYNLCHRFDLWNPTTGEINTLPPRFGWNEDLPFCGFGFDPKAAAQDYDYKVIWVVDDEHGPYQEQDYEVEIYSLKTDSWKRFKCPPKYVTPIRGPTLFINGFFYWPVFFNREPDRAYAIFRFDFSNENFSSPNIPLPDTYKLRDESLSNFIIAEFEGSLAVVAYSHADELAADEKPFQFEIWVWNDESSSWARRGEWAFSVSSAAAGVERPLGLFNNDQLYLRDFMGEVVLFDCATGELKNLGLKSDQTDDFVATKMFAYVDSPVEEEAKHIENVKKLKIGSLSNSTTFISKLAPIVIDSNPKLNNNNNNNNNKHKLLLGQDFEGTLYLSHISTNNNNNSLKESDNSDVLFNFPRLGAQFMPAASCNSALLLCYIDSDCRAALWNPTTDEVKKLPDQLSPSQICRTVWYGFGFDPKSEGDYKVIRFIRNHVDVNMIDKIQAGLYSLKTDSWKDLTSSFSFFDLKTQPLYLNGFCYWVVYKSNSVDSRPNGGIVSFDFANEIFSTAPHIPLPPPNYYDRNTYFLNLLAEFHGSLAALVYKSTVDYQVRGESKPIELEIWVWNSDESSSWSRVSVIHVPAGADEPLGLFGNDQLYLQGSNGEVLLFDCTKGGELQRLGLNASGLRLSKANWGKLGWDCIFPYVESPFPLNGKKIIRASHKIIND